MRSKVAKRILDKTPKDVEIFVRLYGDIVVRINELIKEKNWTQKRLAAEMDKKPSEISKWLNGEHNFTLRSLARLEAELGESIITVPRRENVPMIKGKTVTITVMPKVRPSAQTGFIEGKTHTKSYHTNIAS